MQVFNHVDQLDNLAHGNMAVVKSIGKVTTNGISKETKCFTVYYRSHEELRNLGSFKSQAAAERFITGEDN